MDMLLILYYINESGSFSYAHRHDLWYEDGTSWLHYDSPIILSVGSLWGTVWSEINFLDAQNSSSMHIYSLSCPYTGLSNNHNTRDVSNL